MKPLAKEITKFGFTYTQVAQSPKAYIYAQREKGTDNLLAYEVFEHREHAAREMHGNQIEASVAFPNHEAFGNWAFTYKTIESATAKFTELTNKVKKEA